MIFLIIFLFSFILLVYLIYRQLKFQARLLSFKPNSPPPFRTLIILGSGGHTREILTMTDSLSKEDFSPRLYISSSSDKFSIEKALDFEVKRGTDPMTYSTGTVYRARSVGQSFFTSVFTTSYSILQSIYIIAQYRPHLILCNGPGVCVPLCLIAHMLRLLGILRLKILFVESICRVETLSLSGKILSPIADEFLVQWEEMQQKFPGTKYIGRLC